MSVNYQQLPGLASSQDNEGVPINDLAALSFEDEPEVKVDANASGSYSIAKSQTWKGYSPTSGRFRSPFIIKGNQALHDPFNSPPHRAESLPNSQQRTPAGPKAKRGIMSENWRSGSSSGSDNDHHSSPSREKAARNANRASYPQGRSSEIGHGEIKDEESQSIFPPSCCVFVANLLQSENEESLQVAVTKVFREYGSVFIKIRRDAKQMPFAFCQYTIPEHAERAIRDGRGRLINGRPCRCEKAKAHRLFLVERKYGSVVTPDEIRALLQSFGNITACYTASNVERATLNLNEGVIIEFEMYDEGQAAYASFRNHDIYKFHAIAGLTPPNWDAKSTSKETPPASSDRIYLDQYEIDRRSIFVGNLPAGTTESQVTQLFEHYGVIDNILIRESFSKYETHEKLCFAFVEFSNALGVTRAIPAKNGFYFGGKVLRVSQKDVSRNRRSSSSYHSPSSNHRRSTSTQDQPMSPANFGAFGTPAQQPMPYYGGQQLFSDRQGGYYTAPGPYSPTAPGPYSPTAYQYLSYPGSPAYTTSAQSLPAASGSPGATSYWYPYGYPNMPAVPYAQGNYPTFYPSVMPQPQVPPPANAYPAYQPPSFTAAVQDERASASTPTPAVYDPVESTVESQ